MVWNCLQLEDWCRLVPGTGLFMPIVDMSVPCKLCCTGFGKVNASSVPFSCFKSHTHTPQSVYFKLIYLVFLGNDALKLVSNNVQIAFKNKFHFSFC